MAARWKGGVTFDLLSATISAIVLGSFDDRGKYGDDKIFTTKQIRHHFNQDMGCSSLVSG